MLEFPDGCKQNFGSVSEVKEEAKMSFSLKGNAAYFLKNIYYG